jgi:molybdopterin molybdotransferase
VRDINTYSLCALAQQAGATPVFSGIVPDEPQWLESVARKALAEAELLVISAGSSVSTRDATARVIAALGVPGVLVHGVSLRPGKPTILGVVDGKPVVGLPGNPVSAMVTFELFVTPTIYRLLGCVAPPARYNVRARLTRNVASTTGREDYVQVKLEERDGELWAAPVFGESNLITTMVRADGMAKIPLDLHGMTAGEWVSVRLF